MAPVVRPRTPREVIEYFSDPKRALEFAVSLRWPGGVECPTCGSRDVAFLDTRRVWKCRVRHARRQFSVKGGTIFEDSPIELARWFAAIWMVANSGDGVTATELARELDVTQKTAGLMLDRIHRAARTLSFDMIVQVQFSPRKSGPEGRAQKVNAASPRGPEEAGT